LYLGFAFLPPSTIFPLPDSQGKNYKTEHQHGRNGENTEMKIQAENPGIILTN
jgi:hypothetical protein